MDKQEVQKTAQELRQAAWKAAMEAREAIQKAIALAQLSGDPIFLDRLRTALMYMPDAQ